MSGKRIYSIPLVSENIISHFAFVSGNVTLRAESIREIKKGDAFP